MNDTRAERNDRGSPETAKLVETVDVIQCRTRTTPPALSDAQPAAKRFADWNICLDTRSLTQDRGLILVEFKVVARLSRELTTYYDITNCTIAQLHDYEPRYLSNNNCGPSPRMKSLFGQ